MKNRLMLTLATLLSVTAFNASNLNATIIEDAINDSDLETLRILVTVGTTHNHSFTVTKDEKAQYIELAKTKVEKCIAHFEHTNSLNSVSGLDWLSIIAYSALVGRGLIDIYETTMKSDRKEEKNAFKSVVGLGAFLYGFGNLIRSYKDVMKHVQENKHKAKEDLIKAEKVLTLVEAIPVEA